MQGGVFGERLIADDDPGSMGAHVADGTFHAAGRID